MKHKRHNSKKNALEKSSTTQVDFLSHPVAVKRSLPPFLPPFSQNSIQNISNDNLEHLSTTEQSLGNVKNEKFKNSLKVWCIENKITHTAFSQLLKILKNEQGLHFLPEDSRSLLKVKKVSGIEKMGNGSFYHFGIKNMVLHTIKMFSLSDFDILHLQINVDGLPLTKSSKSQFWPILGHIEETQSNFVFPIGVYHGTSKPDSPDVYLSTFITEFKEIEKSGISNGRKNITLCISKILCDAPAKSFVLNVKSHNAYFGCTKCTTEGDYYSNRMVFNNLQASLRLDSDFKNYTDEEYHRGMSPLLQLNLGLVSQVPLDYMHLVCLGVMKRLLMFWIKGNKSHRFSEEALKNINKTITDYKHCAITEFARKPRNLDDLDHWKATEYRQFLMYYGPIVIQPYLEKQLYVHFLSFHIAIRILASPKLCIEFNDYAHKLLFYFVEMVEHLYGKEYVNHNVHNLIHLAADVKKHGSLDNFSCFKFENYMSEIKKMIKPSKHPLTQFVNRVTEKLSVITHVKQMDFQLFQEVGFDKIDDEEVVVYKQVNFNNMVIQNKPPNCYCFLKNLPARIIKIFKKNNNCYVQFKRYTNYKPMYEKPLCSTIIFCGCVDFLKDSLEIANLTDIEYKAVKMNKYFIGTLHGN